MKITPQTTLAELEYERARLGIERFLVMIRPGGVDISIVTDDSGLATVDGADLVSAIDAAFALREQQIIKLVNGGRS